MSFLGSTACLGFVLLGAPSGGKPPGGERASLPSASAPASAASCHWRDFDLDGAPDVYVRAPGGDRLLRNAGGRFEDVSRQLGLAPRATRAAEWVDLDGDGL